MTSAWAERIVPSPPRLLARPLEFQQRPWVPWVLVASHAAALEVSLLLGYLLRKSLLPWFPVGLGSAQYVGLAVGVLVVPLAYCLAGLYPGFGLGAVERLRRQVHATLAVFAVLIAWDYLMQGRSWSRGILLGTVAFAVLLMPLVEGGVRGILVRSGCWGVPVVVLGAARTGALVLRNLRREPGLGLVPVAILDDDPATWNSSLEGVPVAGPLLMAGELAHHVRLAVVAMPGLQRERLAALLADLPFPDVIVIPNLFGLQTLWVTARDLGGVLGLQVKNNLLLWHNRLLKRFLDLLVAVPLLAFAAPVIVLLAFWIKRRSRGSAFYTQQRAGSSGRVIRIWKLRTMDPRAPALLEKCLADPEQRREWERFYKLKNDPRVLPGIGRLLRRTSLDELPQLWNVLKGEMSLVGPRPLPAYHLESFRSAFRELRQRVPPGMTGMWQVTARSDGDLTAQEALDTYYIRNWSLWLDLYLIAQTVRAVLTRQGAC